MTALSTPRATDEVQGVLRQVPVKGGALLFEGALAMAVAGLAQPGAPAAGAVALGRVEWGADNRTGADGATTVMVKRGVFHFANAAADAVPAAQIGAPCFNARNRRPGSVCQDVALADVLTIDLAVTIGLRRGASKAAAKASAETAVGAYMAERRQIGERVAVSLIEGEAAVSNVTYAHLTSFAADLLPSREQAFELGTLTVTPVDADA